MSDVQNFFLEALAVIFVKVQYLYFRIAISGKKLKFIYPINNYDF